ncbi:hypothetical protein DMH25_08280 [Streptomyces sp. WAC 01325]|uniref:hypothetical protein n=1 Tax=Streptomyces sp. WAC 01325 TaxID=2203202 RepID=UPI000F871BFD|nr:hypothetical protein [Streptomyces sp. WAC 01325]RSN13775.1 hypothetical protein DMH25_08280 [Streptomyces sp. WAC 01325]
MSPRKGNAHDHALEVETLQEKADRIRREQGLPPEAEEGPQPCHWYDDGHGGRFLIPGCMTRVMNPDADECACRSIEEQLAAARREIADLTKQSNGLQTWHDHIVRAVYDHPDGTQIMKRAADRAGVGR